MIIVLLYYTRVHNVCVYIQSTHWLVPGYCLGQIFLRGEERPSGQSWNLSNGDSSLAKIGLNLVSCSCGNMESHRYCWSTNRLRHQPVETICCTHTPESSCTAYFVFCFEFLYQVGASSANSNPWAGEHNGHSLEINTQKTGRDKCPGACPVNRGTMLKGYYVRVNVFGLSRDCFVN